MIIFIEEGLQIIEVKGDILDTEIIHVLVMEIIIIEILTIIIEVEEKILDILILGIMIENQIIIHLIMMKEVHIIPLIKKLKRIIKLMILKVIN